MANYVGPIEGAVQFLAEQITALSKRIEHIEHEKVANEAIIRLLFNSLEFAEGRAHEAARTVLHDALSQYEAKLEAPNLEDSQFAPEDHDFVRANWGVMVERISQLLRPLETGEMPKFTVIDGGKQ